MTRRFVYYFHEGSAKKKDLLGGKGANLAEMTRVGLNVPPGFTITTEACRQYLAGGGKLCEDLKQEIETAVKWLEAEIGKVFGDNEAPLLVSVRSGAPVSMPGMMDTILNLGLNDESVEGLSGATGDRRFALDCYRRFIQMFGEVVMKVSPEPFEDILAEARDEEGVHSDAALSAGIMAATVEKFKEVVKREAGQSFPQDAYEQLFLAVEAVFKSWNNDRAIYYRKVNGIDDKVGTAVNVQTMVFGNMGESSGTGVAFTRNPATGERKVYGEFLENAQGEDVVAGIRTPRPIDELEKVNPKVYKEFLEICERLEKHYKDVQDLEFTIEQGRLFLLQTRTGKRTAQAAVKIAVDMVREGLIDTDTALLRVDPDKIGHLLHRQFDPEAEVDLLATGLPASPGAASGKIVFTADEAAEQGEQGEKVILVRTETTPDDIHGIVASAGVLTSRGGMTSHAAVVARGMGKPAVCGCGAIFIDKEARTFTVSGRVFHEGDIISIDGGTGRVMAGEVSVIEPRITEEFSQILAWADSRRTLGVHANADTPIDARRSREFGAEGIGLCRTEHMFMAQDRLPVVQEMILAESEEERKRALEKLLPMQEGDFYDIFAEMDGLPVTVRLLDPPLHEFLPDAEQLLLDIINLEQKQQRTSEEENSLEHKRELLKKVRALAELNPMLGLRGCRLGIRYPEIYDMQARAIFRAACSLKKEGKGPVPEVMIPLVGHERELEITRKIVVDAARETMEEYGVRVEYKVGTMIELPRACVIADRIARHADFFSFGTNDLTQTTLGYSRDDAESKFIHHYLNSGILPENPFAVLDRDGVGELVREGCRRGRKTNKELKIGICGEHGGNPQSIEFLNTAGLDYVSCSPYRVPGARLAAAQAAIRKEETIE